jgi:excisionase family DNA binding protein
MQHHDYLTTQEVAAYLRLKERTVYDLVARKVVPCSKVTGKLIFPRRLVDRWIDANVQLVEGKILTPPRSSADRATRSRNGRCGNRDAASPPCSRAAPTA